MSTKTILQKLEDVLVLYRHLYMNPENRIVINNGMTDLEIRLDENFRFYCKNLSFPGLSDMYYSEQMTLSCCLGIVEHLKKQEPKQFPDSFNSEWDEISDMVNRVMARSFC